MSPREPDEVLRELGSAVERGWAARRRAPLWRRLRIPRRGAVATIAAVLVLVPTAVATRDALWAPEPPALPEALRGPGAVAPSSTGTAVYVGTGRARGADWRLSASLCDYGSGTRVVGAFLTVPGGGAGARCDAASTALPDSSPAALAARRVHTYFDPRTSTTWVFGTLPAAAREVSVAARAGAATTDVRVPALPADPEAIAKGGLPAGLRLFVAALPGAPEIGRIAVTGEAGAGVLTCDAGRCAP